LRDILSMCGSLPPTLNLRMEGATMQKRLAILLAAYVLVFAGCNTMEGMGEDMEFAGAAIEDEAADDVDQDDE
jgi:predicted small secreted protein